LQRKKRKKKWGYNKGKKIVHRIRRKQEETNMILSAPQRYHVWWWGIDKKKTHTNIN
jgi:hypothetical protein